MSTPIDEEGDIYDDDQQFFQLKLLKPAEIKFDVSRHFTWYICLVTMVLLFNGWSENAAHMFH